MLETLPANQVKELDVAALKPPLNITLITEEKQLSLVEDYFSRVPLFALDIETNVADDFTDRRVRTIQLGDRNEQYVIDLLPFVKRHGQTLETAQGPVLSPAVPYSPQGLPHASLSPVVSLLSAALDSERWLKVGHYLQFEYETLLFCLGIRLWNIYDTILAEKLIYAGVHSPFESGFWALDDLARRYCNIHLSKTNQKSFDLVSDLRPDQIEYCALDIRVPMAVKGAQQVRLEQANLMQVAKIEFDAVPAFGEMFLNGIQLDEKKWLDLIAATEIKHKENIAALDEHFLPVVGSKDDFLTLETELHLLQAQFDALPAKTPESKEVFLQARAKKKEITALKKKSATCQGQAMLNYASSAQILEALQKMGFDISDTNEKTTLRKLAKKPVIAALLAYRDTAKSLSTYGTEFLKHIHPKTRRIHSRISQIGAATGRTSSRDPNLQNIKRESAYRTCFVARPGFKMLTLDYNGAELRIATEYTREPAWLEAFNKGWDVHSVGAEIVYGQEWKDGAEEGCAYFARHEKCECKTHKSLRTKVKSINFGIAYGLGPQNLAIELGITETEAKELLGRYRQAFPTLVSCLEEMGKAVAKSLVARSLSQRARFFRQPTLEDARESCKRRFGVITQMRLKSAYKGLYAAIEREGRNHSVQATNADMVKLAMGCGADANRKKFLWHLLRELGALLVLMVHDELVFEVPDHIVERAFGVCIDGMVRGGEAFIKCVPTVVEGKPAQEWSK